MSILIPGMKMPTRCVDCLLEIQGYCFPLKDFIAGYRTREDRPENCPIIELPPHGRLGDLDALFRTMNDVAWYSNADRDEVALEIVLNAKTIIEAEGE